MTLKTQVIAINKLLSDIYLQPMRLSYLLAEMNFSQEDIDIIAERLLLETINNFLASLQETFLECHDGERLFKILDTGYGLDGQPCQTLHSIGEELGISKERARQLKNKAIRKIKANKNASQ